MEETLIYHFSPIYGQIITDKFHRRSIKVTLFLKKHIKIFLKKLLTYHHNAPLANFIYIYLTITISQAKT